KASRDKGEDTGFSVPDIVSSTLNALPQPLVLIDPAGQLLFANDVAVKLMGVDSWPEIGEVTTLADALAALEGEDGSISLFTAKDEAINLDVMITAFPWKDGPVYQATLSPGSDGEEADNRRAVGSKKNTEKVTSAPLAADNPAISSPETAGDNVVSLRPEKPDCGPSDEELRAILDTATDGIVTLDAKGRICSFSAGAEALFGYRSAEVSGKKFSKLLAGKSRKVISDYLEALSGSGLAAVFNDGREVEAKVNNGGIISLFLTIGRLETVRTRAGIIDDGTAAFCVVVRDITQWKKTEADLRKSKESAEKSNAQKSMFLANISHELRTPLNAIMGFSEVMRSERFGEIENEKYLAYANDIHASGGHLLALINDLLDLAKVESGKLELNFTSVNLLNIIDESIHSLQEQATANRVLVRKSAPGDLPNVVADMRSMKQIMLNLLSNSVKFSPPGGQVIITVKLEDNGEMLLTVKDTGRGMDKAELKRALEPFQRVERTADAQTQGTGLGLPLTKALVEANRAKFTITSAPKKGTLVEIVFPTTRVLAE
ncbi:MAG TPA: PAS domain-containing sensor histidine kinase, partial [Rhizobiales bacterium]|nr:PAS domain-containing sensor histidine kinase [Hyphomicrobiales bacterium]